MAATTDKSTSRPRRKAADAVQDKPVSIRCLLPHELAAHFYQYLEDSNVSQTAFFTNLAVWFLHQSVPTKMAIIHRESGSSAKVMARLTDGIADDFDERTIAAHEWMKRLEHGEISAGEITDFLCEGINPKPSDGAPQSKAGRKRNK